MSKHETVPVHVEVYCANCEEVITVEHPTHSLKEYIRCPRCGQEREIRIDGKRVEE